MKKRMEALKKNRSKGFTLVELIVVLIILAILAALLVPALTGYIDKANEKQITAETRSCVMAAQTLTDELYASGNTPTALGTPATFTADAIKTLAEAPGTVTEVTFDGGKIATLKYQGEGTGAKFCTYTAATKTYAISDS